MERLGPWREAIKPEQAALAPLAVAVGAAYAHFDAQPGPGLPSHLLAAVAAFAAAAGVHLVDHAWDGLGTASPDPRKPVPEPIRPVSPREAAVGAAGCLALAALAALGVAPLAGPAVVGYGLIAVLLGVARGAPVAGLDTLGPGLGDAANVVALGPLACLVGYASQTGAGSWGAAWAGIPTGLAAAAPLFARHFTRRDVDAALDRQTPVASLGETRARHALLAFPLVAAMAVAVAAWRGEYPPSAGWGVAPLVAAAFAAWRLPDKADANTYERWSRLACVGAAAALVVVAGALLLAPAP